MVLPIVQIVPLWNWNGLSSWTKQGKSSVQIVPLWNWNNFLFNKEGAKYLVQIVPLWNWNTPGTRKEMQPTCSNCTFMELKYIGPLFKMSSVPTFKLYLYGIEMQVFWCADLMPSVQIVPLWNWNWFSTFIIMRFKNVQIVPLWNWNTCLLYTSPSPRD